MPLLKSVAGDMPIALSEIQIKNGEFRLVGMMGRWSAGIAFPRAEFHKMLWSCMRPRVIGFVCSALIKQAAGRFRAVPEPKPGATPERPRKKKG